MGILEGLRTILRGVRMSQTSQSAQQPTIPDGTVAYAIGDIHGRSDLLAALMRMVEADAAPLVAQGKSITIVFLGDYVDRGSDSQGVLDYLLDRLPPGWNCLFLKGNHEEAILSFLADASFGEVWRDYGGIETLASYGVYLVRERGGIDWPATQSAFTRAFPRRHLEFLQRLPATGVIGGYVFVHAGVRPGIPLEYQSEKDLLWIRDEFLEGRRALPQTVVHGHTPNEEVILGDGRIGLDTGAYLTGRLTAAGFEGSRVWYLHT